jgi:hypothetical protein
MPHGLAKMEDDSVRLVKATNKRADFGPEYFLHWHTVRRNDMHDDASRAQRGCHLKANEAGTDHNYLLCRLRFRHNRLTIRERTQI